MENKGKLILPIIMLVILFYTIKEILWFSAVPKYKDKRQDDYYASSFTINALIKLL